jgi:hypothetical protein
VRLYGPLEPDFDKDLAARRSGIHKNAQQSMKAKTEIITITQMVASALLLAAIGNSFAPAKSVHNARKL